MAQQITTEAPPVLPRRRWFRFPVVVLALIALAILTPRVWELLDLDPGPLLYMQMWGTWIVMAAVPALAIWYFLFSGYRWQTKLIAVGMLGVLAGASAAAVSKVELTGSWQPLFRFRWEPDPADQLAQYLSQQRRADGLPATDLTIGPLDFPRYRGSNCDGVVTGVTLATDWSARPPRELWRHACGGGYAGFAVAGNVAVTIEQRGDDEAVVCYDRATGKERWVHSYPALFHRSEPMGGDGPRTTPNIHDGLIYSLGATGVLVCLDAEGKEKWKVNILDDNQATNIDWGMSGSPLIVDDLVVVNPGINPAVNAGMSLAAYDRKTGKKAWAANNRAAGYSSPQLATLAGQRQILLFDAVGLGGFDPKDGRQLWSHPWETMMNMNISQPLVIGPDQVLISSELSNGAALLRIKRDGDQFAVEEVWQNRNLASKFSNPVLHGGNIYGLNYRILACLDAATGDKRWKDGKFGHGQVLLVGDIILVLSETGEVALVAADPASYRELARIKALTGKTWNTPALAGNQLFVRNHYEMACYELPAK